MKKLSFIFFWSILVGTLSFLQADILQSTEENIIDRLIENAQFCVESVHENKIFLRIDRIKIREDGLFIDLNGSEFLRLPFLYSHANGVFLLTNSILDADLPIMCKKATKGPCPNCNVPTDKDGRCINLMCAFCGYQVL